MMLPVIYERVAGLDVHKKMIVATRMRVIEGQVEWETNTFGSMTPDLLLLHDWLDEWSCIRVAMESTADYWKPVYNILEEVFEIVVVNSAHVKHVPGRKTDVKDSEWLAELMMHGLLTASFVPPKPQRALRTLTRYRTTLVQERARVVNRVQKLLEEANIKLASVATNIQGVSARAILAELAVGQTDAKHLANLARGKMRSKIPALEKALTGLVQPHHRFLLTRQLAHIDFLDEQVEELNTEIARQVETMSNSSAPTDPGASAETNGDSPGTEQPRNPLTWSEAVALLDTIPGVDRCTAEVMLAEMGLDMSHFPTDKHLATWAGLAPGNHQSAGKRYSGRTPHGNRPLSSIMVQAAWAAIRTQDSFLKARYHRLAARRGKKRAIVAVAHSMLVSAWHMLTNRQAYHELGGDYFDHRQKDMKVNYLIRRLEKLTGGSISIEIQPAAV